MARKRRTAAPEAALPEPAPYGTGPENADDDQGRKQVRRWQSQDEDYWRPPKDRRLSRLRPSIRTDFWLQCPREARRQRPDVRLHEAVPARSPVRDTVPSAAGGMVHPFASARRPPIPQVEGSVDHHFTEWPTDLYR